MDNLKNLWYITTNHEEISNLIRSRGEQLDVQTQIDFGLRHKCQECPETVGEILLLERYWNRNSSRGFQYCPSVELYMESVKDNIKKMDVHQKELHLILSTNDLHNTFCANLKTYLDKLQRVD